VSDGSSKDDEQNNSSSSGGGGTTGSSLDAKPNIIMPSHIGDKPCSHATNADGQKLPPTHGMVVTSQ
jgi:hypothetical protein